MKSGITALTMTELQDASDKALSLLNCSEAVITYQTEELDVKELFKKLFEAFKKDQEAPMSKRYKFENIMNTIIFFVSEEDFKRFKEGPNITFKKHDNSKKALAKFIDDLQEWGGVKQEELLSVIQEKDP